MDYINELAQQYAPMDEAPQAGKRTEVYITLASDEADLGKLHKLLASNGFPVLDLQIKEQECEKPILAGSRVQTNNPVMASEHVVMKTPTTLYTVAEAVLPARYIGEVVSIEKNAATVNFDANIKVTARDSSGYLSTQDYYVGTLKVDLKDLNVL